MSKKGASPRYLQIAGWLRELAFRSTPGTLLPSEAEVAERFGVSRMTARSAMQYLEKEGVIVRRQGAGTFSQPSPIHRHEGALMSFTTDMERRGLTVTSKLIVAELRTGTEAETAELGLPAEHKVVSIQRVRLADGTPLAIERATIAPDCAQVLSHDLEVGSLHDALAELGRPPVVAHAWISSRGATPAEAAYLEVPEREPLLVERRVINDVDDAPLEFTETAYIGNRYVINAVFSSDSRGQVALRDGDRHRAVPLSASEAQSPAPIAPA